jgi:threonine aldolase
LGGTQKALKSFTVDAGVDVISFGGAKNGMMYGEAVIYLDPELARSAPYVRKQVTQLPSKVRYISAQFSALLTDDLWIKNARHANAMATHLYEKTVGLSGVQLDGTPEVNSIFPVLPANDIEALRDWSFFYDWDAHHQQVRWMTAWDTELTDIDQFVAGIGHFVG